MDYQLLINNTTVLYGDLNTAVSVIALSAILITIIVSIGRHKIRESEKMKYEFITIIAHKFRTPLTTARWLLENMAAEETDPKKKENFRDLGESNNKLITLTGTLIELTNHDRENKTSYTWEKVSLGDFVKNVTGLHRDLFHEKNIFLNLNLIDPNTQVSIDKVRLEFVLQTILENACNYTFPGREVEISVFKDGHRAKVAVKDRGIGIAKADLPKIFHKFYRTENARKTDTEGFGVGLFLAQSIIRQHRGKIRVSSPGPNEGSTFTIELPCLKD